MTTANFAHRGVRSLAPENTIPAYQMALACRADGIEVDLQVTSDFQLVLFHDRTLQRTTNVAKCFPNRSADPLHSFSLAELQTLDAGSWFITRDPFGTINAGEVSATELRTFENTRIPRFSELLEFLSSNHLKLNLELKKLPRHDQLPSFIEKVFDLLKSSGITPDRLSVSSFEHEYLKKLLEYRPDFELHALIDCKITDRFLSNTPFVQIINANAKRITYKQYRKAQAKGFSINLYTVNDIKKMQEFLNWGVAGIITDYPQHLTTLVEG